LTAEGTNQVVEETLRRLRQAQSEAEGVRLLEGLSRAELLQLANRLAVPYADRLNKAELRYRIVRATTSERMRRENIERMVQESARRRRGESP